MRSLITLLLGLSAITVVTCVCAADPPIDVNSMDALTYMPKDQQLIIQLNIQALRRHKLFSKSIEALNKQLNDELKKTKTGKLASLFDLTMENVALLTICGGLADKGTQSAKAEMPTLMVLQFIKPVELSSILRLGTNPDLADERSKQFVAELMNGKIVFFLEDYGLLAYQATPNMLVIGSRETVKQVTRLKPRTHLGRNKVLRSLIRKNGEGQYVSGALRLPTGDHEPVRNIRLVLDGQKDQEILKIYLPTNMRESTAALEVLVKKSITDKSTPFTDLFVNKWSVQWQATEVVIAISLDETIAGSVIGMTSKDSKLLRNIGSFLRKTPEPDAPIEPSAKEPGNGNRVP